MTTCNLTKEARYRGGVVGGRIRGILGRLRSSGLSGDALKMALAAVAGTEMGGGNFKLTRKQIKKISSRLGEFERIVIIRKNKDIRVMSIESYVARQKNALTNKPWEHRHRPAPAAPQAVA